ncbi:MAG: serine--tRNA ligase, partial [Verrucomicrobiae bacterium]|nr:serine--tRNA ligase [Verrucomicrobiae bacterium]
MLDMKFVRENPELVEKAMKNRNMDMNLDEFLTLEKQRREILQQVETLKSERNSVSQEIS